ncbi:MAG: hypothetical protein A2571_02045 [Candidatus Vogelbacteria bacterium RIFOXYD1_FULL_44_32]|uniref:Methyltransferase domain-containing protein n=1 Tax=Candidatus Vogelbacteria bacterium RIFOXYD1_FULL_44_32 TaxID=1802438 RepID=A0A1G2QD71_9BACT|nr:MAG: hypothetical protein A2571_02045 [Candidatus Vogelbacteria bacterium RIFOXYD1_FULL_44_32]
MFARPDQILNYLALTPGMKVADFGAGSGEYVLGLARRVAPGGRVIAVDIQPELLTKIAGQAKASNLGDIVDTIWGDVETRGGSKLADQAVDVVILSNIMFQVDSAYSLALEAKRVLNLAGKVLVVDWKDSFGNLGPTKDKVITPAKCEQIMNEAGLIKDNEFEAGDHHYGQIYVLNQSKL